MHFQSPLIPGQLVKRYKRFLADIILDDGTQITAHCANPGSMMGVAPPGAKVWVSKSNNKTRKYPHSWEIVAVDDTLVAINTNNPNKIAAEAITKGAIPELTGYEGLRQEVKYGEENSRIDILLEKPKRKNAPAQCFVEVKNVHLKRKENLAEFPDSVTARGTKHLRELATMVTSGHRAVMLYIIQRGDCREFSIARDIDPKYYDALLEAQSAGVDLLCYDCEITPHEVVLRRPIPICF